MSTSDPRTRGIGGGIYVNEVSHGSKVGALKRSERPYDLALQGDGYFLVGDDRAQFYTRDGRFQRDPSTGVLTR